MALKSLEAFSRNNSRRFFYYEGDESSGDKIMDRPLASLGNDAVRSPTCAISDVNNSPKVTAESFAMQSRTKLENTFFAGTYEDRVYVENLCGYRDRVTIDQDETHFVKNLRSVLRKGKKLQGDQFCGIESKLYSF